jgi:hypothetical protein
VESPKSRWWPWQCKDATTHIKLRTHTSRVNEQCMSAAETIMCCDVPSNILNFIYIKQSQNLEPGFLHSIWSSYPWATSSHVIITITMHFQTTSWAPWASYMSIISLPSHIPLPSGPPRTPTLVPHSHQQFPLWCCSLWTMCMHHLVHLPSCAYLGIINNWPLDP